MGSDQNAGEASEITQEEWTRIMARPTPPPLNERVTSVGKRLDGVSCFVTEDDNKVLRFYDGEPNPGMPDDSSHDADMKTSSREQAEVYRQARQLIQWKLKAPAITNTSEDGPLPRRGILGLFRVVRSCNSLQFRVGNWLSLSLGWGAHQ